MLMMTIPNDFKWSNKEFETLNNLSNVQKKRVFKTRRVKYKTLYR